MEKTNIGSLIVEVVFNWDVNAGINILRRGLGLLSHVYFFHLFKFFFSSYHSHYPHYISKHQFYILCSKLCMSITFKKDKNLC